MNKLRNLFEKIRTFLKEVKIEMKKVTWPSREDLTNYTTVVLFVVLIMSIFIGIVDKIMGIFLEIFLHI
jgi:preprotein translocase subunit SecE